MIGWWLGWKKRAACELENSKLPKIMDLTCCCWMQLQVLCVWLLNASIAEWLADDWEHMVCIHPHTQVVHLILHNSELFSISIVANGLHFQFCVVAVCVCVWWLATPLAYWFPQHRECVATTNSGMWPKSKIAELNLSMPIERGPEAKSNFLVFILKPITIPPSSNLAKLFWNV